MTIMKLRISIIIGYSFWPDNLFFTNVEICYRHSDCMVSDVFSLVRDYCTGILFRNIQDG